MTNTSPRYTIHSQTRSGSTWKIEHRHTLRAAKHLARTRCIELGDNPQPVWVEGPTSWNCRSVVGGYDAGSDTGNLACAVVHRGPMADD